MKYPRTRHIPNSEGISDDDEILENEQCLIGKNVIYTEKLDGECTSLKRHACHARSEESAHHPSQSWVKSLHAQIAWKIPEYIQIVGENVYAKHSIFYDKLSTFFYVFAAIDLEGEFFLSVHDTLEICDYLDLKYVPILHKGMFDATFKVPTKSAFGDEIEGYVVRNVDEFPVDKMSINIAKWVRKAHVKTDDHWKTKWLPNRIIDGTH